MSLRWEFSDSGKKEVKSFSFSALIAKPSEWKKNFSIADGIRIPFDNGRQKHISRLPDDD